MEYLRMNNETYYSAYEDEWSYSERSIEEAAQMVLDEMDDIERRETKVITIYKGVKKPQNFDQFLCVDRLLEDMSESACEQIGDYAESYLSDVTESQKKELESLIVSWASRNNISPSWFMIEDIEEVKFTIPDDWD
jgi:hypothetical protein